MATTTTRLALRKPNTNPTTGDFVDADADINDNMDKIDAAVGAVACTSGARPSTPYNGMFARETDTGNLILWNGASWIRIYNEGQARWVAGILLNLTASTTQAWATKIPADTANRFQQDTAGKQEWGPGAGTAVDTNLYRSSAGVLKSDQVIQATNLPVYSARQTLVSTAASVSFTSIPTTIKRLRFYWTARCNNAVMDQLLLLRVNNDSTGQYSWQYMRGSNATPSAAAGVSQTSAAIGIVLGASATALVFASGDGMFVGWDSPHPSYLSYHFQSQSMGIGAANFSVTSGGGVYAPIGAYNRIDILPQAGSFVAGSDFHIEGW